MASEYGQLKITFAEWSIRHDIAGGASDERTIYTAARGDVLITAESPAELRSAIIKAEHAHGWRRRGQ